MIKRRGIRTKPWGTNLLNVRDEKERSDCEKWHKKYTKGWWWLGDKIEKLINNISNIFGKGANAKQWSRYSVLFFFFFKQNDAETTGHSHGKKWVYKFIPFTKTNSK